MNNYDIINFILLTIILAFIIHIVLKNKINTKNKNHSNTLPNKYDNINKNVEIPNKNDNIINNDNIN